MEIRIVDKGHEGLFEAYEGDVRLGFMSYVWEGKQQEQFGILHTIVEPEFEGHGVGSALLDFAADYARRNGKKIHDVCPFVTAKFRRSDKYDDIIAYKR